MAVKIRLKRFGTNQKVTYRLVATDERRARDGSYIELLGNYNPRTNALNLNEDKIMKWLKIGAKPTDSARTLISKAGIMSKFAKERDANKAAKRTKAEPKPKVKPKAEPKAEPKKAAKPKAKPKATSKPKTAKTKKAGQ